MPSSNGVSAGPIITAFLYTLKELSFREPQTSDGRYLPGHDIVGDGRGRDTCWRIGLHALVGREAWSAMPWWQGMMEELFTLKSRIKRRRAVVDIAMDGKALSGMNER